MKNKIKENCSACGTAPVNHNFLFFSKVIDEVISKVCFMFFHLFPIGKYPKITDFFEKIFLTSFFYLGFIRYSSDIEKANSGRSKLMWEEAISRGIDMKQMILFGQYTDSYKAKVNGKTIFFQSLPIPPWLSQKGYGWIDDKYIFSKKLNSVGIPVPKTKKVLFLKDALKAFDKLQKPLIIKPQSGSRGRHTTTNINTKEELKKAFYLARQISPSMVLQEHLFGSVYRATVVNNTLVGFFRADAPFIIGDGTKSIKELIIEKNKNRNERVSDILINEELLFFIKRQNYKISDVPLLGVKIDLLAKTGRFYGGYTKEMLPEIHPKFHFIFNKASKFTSIPVAGFDLIILDPTKDPEIEHWGIIECNTLPFIDLHFFPLEGEPINVAKNVWDLWNKK